MISSVASSIHVYDVESGRLVLGPIQGHTEPVICVLSMGSNSSRCHMMNQGKLDFLDIPTTSRRFTSPRRFCHSPTVPRLNPNLSKRYTPENSAFASRSLR
ncbi:hypothetical protein PAXRUDRAFT_829282 [Paxillus rubicundulus Ve08.2h10]|uniref:Uncharacterized protein n=1 Tax=Paxillus rubicundulus Ve08.2h10 TaxID=930991 RepID=A0A0D0E650_9AGAM|nr:hypothetical protein PAXRUDRAFT_829282 [Paxillus rubicundulus Ve08.2h10]